MKLFPSLSQLGTQPLAFGLDLLHPQIEAFISWNRFAIFLSTLGPTPSKTLEFKVSLKQMLPWERTSDDCASDKAHRLSSTQVPKITFLLLQLGAFPSLPQGLINIVQSLGWSLGAIAGKRGTAPTRRGTASRGPALHALAPVGQRPPLISPPMSTTPGGTHGRNSLSQNKCVCQIRAEVSCKATCSRRKTG